jgi:hypothetical protein
MSTDPFQDPLSRLVGKTCTEITVLSGTLQCAFAPITISIKSAWRVVGADFALGSGSDSEGLERRLQSVLVGAIVATASTSGDLGDLVIETDSALRMESFADSGDYESWRMAGPSGDWLIAGPGALGLSSRRPLARPRLEVNRPDTLARRRHRRQYSGNDAVRSLRRHR